MPTASPGKSPVASKFRRSSVLLQELSSQATCKADLQLLARYASLQLVRPELIQKMLDDKSRRRQRVSITEARELLGNLGLETHYFQGDLRDIEEAGQPVIAVMQGNTYLLILLVDRRVVMAQGGHDLHPITIRRTEFNRAWTQGWLVRA